MSPDPARTTHLGPPQRNVFLMIRYREDSRAHAEIDRAIEATLNDYGLVLIRADRSVHHEELFSNVRQNMDGSRYGIAVFERIGGEPISPNVALELGYMLAKDKPCLLMREKGSALPADLAGHLCREFELVGDIERSVGDAVRGWLPEIWFAKRPDERLLVYVSHGGTCRDPMAKAITERLLAEREPGLRVRVEAMADREPSLPEASFGAQEAIRRLYGEDLLADHVARQITPRIEQEADLILVMSEGLVNPRSAAARKTAALKPFFGLQGDVADPWVESSQESEETIARYVACRDELRHILEENFDRLVATLRAGSR